MGFEYLGLFCFLPFGIYLYIIDIIGAIQYLTKDKRFYPLAVRIRFFFYKKMLGEERFNDYKDNFDKKRKWRFMAYCHIVFGMIGALFFLFLFLLPVLAIFYPDLYAFQ